MEEIEEELELIDSPEEETQEKSVNTPLSDEEVLAICKEQFATAKKNKVEIDKKIEDWRNMADGKPLGNEVDGRSKYVAKEAQKAISWWIPNAIKPFMSSTDIVDFAPRTFDDVEKAKSQNTLINYQFNNDFPKYQFLHTALSLFSTEGTTVARLGWLHEEETEEIPFEGVTQDQLEEFEQTGAEITIESEEEVYRPLLPDEDENTTPLSDILYTGIAIITKTTKSRPDAKSIKNEDFFIIGETIETSEACIQRIDATREEMRKFDKKYDPKNGIFTGVDDIAATGTDGKEAGLGQSRQDDLNEYGATEDDEISGRDSLTRYEYYGEIDRDGTGIPQPLEVVWSGNTILKISSNPFPDEKPPFIGAPFMSIPFSFWGNGLPHYLDDVTKVKSAIMRTFIDLMATSTNGIKHVEKGALDVMNMRRLKEAKIGSVVEWNDIGKYEPQVQNDIPTSLQTMYELFTAEGENESGITRYNQGLDAKSLNKTATGITAIMNQSQMRTWETVTRFSEQFLVPLFRKWIEYNKEFLDTSIAVRVVGDEYTEVTPEDIKGNFDLTVNVAIAGSEEMKSQKIIGMLNMITPLVESGVLPVNHITKMIAELEELSGFKELAQELKQIADQKAEAKNQAMEGFMSLPEDMQIQIMQQAQEQMGNPNQGTPN